MRSTTNHIRPKGEALLGHVFSVQHLGRARAQDPFNHLPAVGVLRLHDKVAVGARGALHAGNVQFSFFYKSVCLLIDGHSRIKLLACSVTIKDRHSRENAVLLL